MRMLTRKVLERAGYRVIEAANGADGLRALERLRRPASTWSLTDVVMPDGMSGRELADKLLTMQPELARDLHERLQPGLRRPRAVAEGSASRSCRSRPRRRKSSTRSGARSILTPDCLLACDLPTW